MANFWCVCADFYYIQLVQIILNRQKVVQLLHFFYTLVRFLTKCKYLNLSLVIRNESQYYYFFLQKIRTKCMKKCFFFFNDNIRQKILWLRFKITILVHTFKLLWVKIVSFYNNWSFKKNVWMQTDYNCMYKKYCPFLCSESPKKINNTSWTKRNMNKKPEW